MTLEEIFDEWKRDAEIDKSDLGNEASAIPLLHHKWFRTFSQERIQLRRLEQKLSKLRHLKQQFYQNGPTRETEALGWKFPPQGRILKTEVSKWVDNDSLVVQLAEEVSLQAEKVDVLENIVKSVNNRNFVIKSALDWLRFTNGV
jgi:hypothetical protein